MKNLTICDNLANIKDTYNRILKRTKHAGRSDDVVELQDMISDIVSMTDDIVRDAEDMRDGAVKMEERLRQYKMAIEGLGFERVKKNS